MRILILDNYDSFTYNLVHQVYEVGYSCDVFRNDKVEASVAEDYDKIILSPGPGVPDEAGVLKEMIDRYGATKSILGVCLGHQAIGEVFGGELQLLERVYHGVATDVKIVGTDYVFDGVDPLVTVGRYHSWIVNRASLPDCLEVTVEDTDGEIMAFKHSKFDVHGVQFHPESVLTPIGAQLMKNFLNHN